MRAIDEAIQRPTGPVEVVMAEASAAPLTEPVPLGTPARVVVTVTFALCAEVKPVIVNGKLLPDAVPTVTIPAVVAAEY